ncbi:30S ribosomal protein S4e [Candidatus Woesearchaeota archaeon]|nr:30S ribosomal protein S4e [Candidatus Woesearchaeota archaeon]
MSKLHLKRIITPRTWFLPRKQTKFITRPNSGPHSFKFSFPMSFFLKKTGFASTTNEAKKILNVKTVFVDGKRIKDAKFPVGLMDSVNIKDAKGFFRVVLDEKGRLKILSIPEAETKIKICKVNNKTMIKNKKIQINLFDGKNVLTEDASIKTGDSVVLELPSLKIKNVLKFEKGASVLMIGGRHMGSFGVIEKIENKKLIVKSGQDTFDTEKRFVFVIGKEVVQLK